MTEVDTDYKGSKQKEAKPGFFYGYVIVGVSLLIIVLMLGLFLSFGVFFKRVSDEFGWSNAMTSGAFALAWIVQGILSIFMGRLNDRFGPRLTLSIAGLLMGLGYLLLSQMNSFWQLYLFYGVVLGAGVSGAFVPLSSTIARWFIRRRSTMTGIMLSGGSIGMFVAPLAASWLIQVYDGWRTPYIILGSVILVMTVALAQFLRRDPAQKGQKPYGADLGAAGDMAPGTASFSTREALHTRPFWIIALMLFLVGYTVTGTNLHIVPFATDLKIPEVSAANILSIIGITGILGGIGLGRFGDKFGNRKAYIIGFSVMMAALLWLTTAGNLWQLYVFASVFGFALQGCLSLQTPLVAELFGLESIGVTLGSLSLAYNIGSAAGSFFTGYIHDVTGNYLASFITGAIFSGIALASMIILRPVRKPKSAGFQTPGKLPLP